VHRARRCVSAGDRHPAGACVGKRPVNIGVNPPCFSRKRLVPVSSHQKTHSAERTQQLQVKCARSVLSDAQYSSAGQNNRKKSGINTGCIFVR
jgi:hypothetical protein